MLDDQRYRAMWSQVVLQAKDDIETEQRGSITYEQAEAFFVGSGQWAEARASIAGMINLHADDLKRLGRVTIAARRTADGLPPMLDRIETPPAPTPAPMPALIAILAPEKVRGARRQRRYGSDNNPFSPSFRSA